MRVREAAAGEAAGWQKAGFGSEADWLDHVQAELPRVIPFLARSCGLEFRGRILEIGAGAAGFSAELSKLPNVVEIFATDISPAPLKAEAPKVFQRLHARSDKITRLAADFHRLDFPNHYFDFVVCSALLQRGVNVTQVLREARRVLKPGGQFVAIREPVKPRIKLKARARSGAPQPGEACYMLAEYQDFFARAGLELEVKRVNLSRGFKYYFDRVVKGLTPAHYVFIGTRRGKS